MAMLPNSTFLDAFGGGLYTTQQYQQLVAGSQQPLQELFQYGSQTATVG